VIAGSPQAPDQQRWHDQVKQRHRATIKGSRYRTCIRCRPNGARTAKRPGSPALQTICTISTPAACDDSNNGLSATARTTPRYSDVTSQLVLRTSDSSRAAATTAPTQVQHFQCDRNTAVCVHARRSASPLAIRGSSVVNRKIVQKPGTARARRVRGIGRFRGDRPGSCCAEFR
jgi:hypothetical protein